MDLRQQLRINKPIKTTTVAGCIPIKFHPSLSVNYEKLKTWTRRFLHVLDDEAIIEELLSLQLLANKKYLDNRTAFHLFRLTISLYYIQRRLINSILISSINRHVVARLIPTELVFAFSVKPVLGCVVGFNILDRGEIFDEDNVVVFLEKYFPELSFVKGSYYKHTSQNSNLYLVYFELEKKDHSLFSSQERALFKKSLEENIHHGIQKLLPMVFMNNSEEETYKNLLVLSQEIHSIEDVPQVSITLDPQTSKEIVFQVAVVQISPGSGFSFTKRLGNNCLSEKIIPIKKIGDCIVEGYLLKLLLPQDPTILRSNGSFDFYLARQEISNLIQKAVGGRFRDYNGGLFSKQQERLLALKSEILKYIECHPVIIENFFYALVPLEKQALTEHTTLFQMFSYFLEQKSISLNKDYSFTTHQDEIHLFVIVHSKDASIIPIISHILQHPHIKEMNFIYNFMEVKEGTFFNLVITLSPTFSTQDIISLFEEGLAKWTQKQKSKQVLRVVIDTPIVSLDPRVGGETHSSEFLRLLFEGLTRLDDQGNVQNALAEQIITSADNKEYTFILRPCFWNNGTLITADDFAYAWKKILSPQFKTLFSYLLYPIKNAQAAKEGKVSIDEVGIHVIDNRTLKIELEKPVSYFLKLLSYTIFSPVHRWIDQTHPQWSSQVGQHYPCNGPFQVVMSQSNQGYRLVKNPFYWDATSIRLDEIHLSHMSPVEALQAFEQQQVDWMGQPFGYIPPSIAFEKKALNGVVVTTENPKICWSIFNTESLLLRNRNLRYALSLAIDRKQIEALYKFEPAYSILPSAYHYEETSRIFPEYNPEEAKLYLKKALQELNLSKEQLCPGISFMPRGALEKIAYMLQRQWNKVLGIQVDLCPIEWSLLFPKISEGKFEIALLHWSNWLNDPLYSFTPFKSYSEGTLSFAKWNNPEFTELLSKSEEAPNLFQRAYILQQAEKLLATEAIVCPIYYHYFQACMQKNCYTSDACAVFNIARIYKKNKN